MRADKKIVKNSPGRDAGGRFAPGCPGGPGRPKGSANTILTQARLWVAEKGLPKMIEAAEGGDLDATRALVALAMPKQKPSSPPLDCLIDMPMPRNTKDLGGTATFLLDKVREGQLSVTDATAVYELASKAVVAQGLSKPFSLEDFTM